MEKQEIEYNLDNIDYDSLLKITKKEEIEVPKPEYKVSNFKKYFKYYGLPITILLFAISITSILWAIKAPIVYIFLAVGLLFPFGLGMFIYLTIRLYLDKHKITSTLIKAVSKNFIVANYMLSNKRVIKRVHLIDKDGISFKTGDLRYIIERDRMWYDENNYPNLFYIPNIPVPLEFNFAKYLIHFRSNIVKNVQPEKILDEYQRPIDVMYTSESLETFRRDKFLKNFHSKSTPEMLKAFYWVSTAFAVVSIALIIYMYLKRGG